jgi:protein-S-isoprenylcysteine O-methyltransferase Ste14
MERRQLKTVIGLALVAIGLVQTVLSALQDEWIEMTLYLLYSCLGIVYLWAEVYTAGQ